MNKRETFGTGFDTGYSIASSNVYDLLNPEFWTEEDAEKFQSEMTLTEMEHYRQFSPFEFFASAINECWNAEGLWDSYDKGVDSGVSRRLKEWKKENKKGFVKEEMQVWKVVKVSKTVVTDQYGNKSEGEQYHSFFGGILNRELWTGYEIGEVSYQKVLRHGEMPLFACKSLEVAKNLASVNRSYNDTFAILLCRAEVSHVKWGFIGRDNIRNFLSTNISYKRLTQNAFHDPEFTIFCKKVLVMGEVERLNA
jgi:hypothetical protein